jgi:Cadherin domain
LFTINPVTGALSFITAPNFEVPTDAGLNNIYDVQVSVSDGTLTDVQSIAVTVTDVNEAPIITSNGGGATASVNVPENTTSVTTVTSTDEDTPAQTLTYTITGGADAALFTINATTGALAFISAPNFENPLDAGANNVYDVQVTVTDNGTPNLSDVQNIAVTVTNANDNPSITSNGGGPTATVSIPENTTPVTTVTAIDPDVPAQTLTYTITGGADAALFTINPVTGALSFITAPNFEVPTDAGLNNIYDVQVTVTDNGTGNLTDVQSIAVTVTDVNEAPAITSNGGGATASVNVPENSTAVTTVTAIDPDAPAQTLTFTITGGADAAFFTINPTTGVLTFITAPDFETPLDAGANNVYDVQVTVTDGALTDVQAIAVTVTDVNEIGLLNAKAMLQGALIGTSNGLMRDDLRTGGYIPLTEPYTALANVRFVHTGGGGGETTTAGVLAANAGTGNAIVDWVFVELRSAVNSSVVIATRSALIQRDGDIVSPTNGTSLLAFPGFAGQQFYVTVKHRNHLSVMTASAVTLTTGGTLVDFTTASNAQVFNKPVGPSMVDYDGVEMVTVQGLRAMWAGNTTADVKVKYQGTSSDNTPVLAQVLSFPGNVSSAYNYNNALGYFSGDVNMDGRVKYQGASNDPSYIFVNIVGLFTPNTSGLYNYDLMIEQLPD